MSVIRAAEAQVHHVHNARFTSYIRPDTGSSELCVWQLEVEPGSEGAGHRVLREEAFVLLDGEVLFTLDGQAHRLEVGDAVLAPAKSTIRLDNPGSRPARLLVSVPVGFSAEMADGTTMTPPWVS
ncbi:cupin domain-containing protein [Nocardia alni]|uniref:cupin domain-containing protein n=1 Tax=Nocardia alni TaxID=2815723 RepID=UPI001C229F06|nr:cupin domain-containing protein [Nocardia alni]